MRYSNIAGLYNNCGDNISHEVFSYNDIYRVCRKTQVTQVFIYLYVWWFYVPSIIPCK